eukprot:Skav225120  [mRNA]  locus=scaffold1239:272109:276463:+ [translate_table: standard]
MKLLSPTCSVPSDLQLWRCTRVAKAATGIWIMRSPAAMFQRPTLADLLKSVQFALRGLMDVFPHLGFNQTPLADQSINVHVRYRGVRMKLPVSLYQQVRSEVASSFANRPLRRSSDLARPAV